MHFVVGVIIGALLVVALFYVWLLKAGRWF